MYRHTTLQLLPERALYLPQTQTLLLSDVHLGKAETFQRAGIPIPHQVNQETLHRLTQLCAMHPVQQMVILGDLFHHSWGMVDAVVQAWHQFLQTTQVSVQLIVGNHDRPLIPALQQFTMHCTTAPVQMQDLVLSHEPVAAAPRLNICGHVHPCFRYKSKLDDIRLPCFFYDRAQPQLILPSFGEFTGGYDVPLTAQSSAYAIAHHTIIAFDGTPTQSR
ncbi:MAG: ligase-associated DNA damage response endonuclease PdeM [Kaiparowitsia implicata GSE-PSE-MK54-09C]|jgi:DNA ligase-associated metallophosphoesterase|nr:ligase-associated DNA damage response endonuclease PdeM [Kaiparowitsia implicata GSE-PSE-MK54-09C]